MVVSILRNNPSNFKQKHQITVQDLDAFLKTQVENYPRLSNQGTEPKLPLLFGEKLLAQTKPKLTLEEVKRSQQTFLNLMVFDSNSCRHLHKSLQKYINERAAEETIVKRAYDAS